MLFFRPFEQDVDARGGVGVVIRLEMQFGDPPQVQTAGEFMPQVVTSVLQGGQGLSLLMRAAGEDYFDGGVAGVGAYGNVGHIHVGQAGIGELKPHDFGELFANRGGYALEAMLHKEGAGFWVLGSGLLIADG
ncbi:MAG TPA: hypothetical protein VMR62_38290 [Bryobacteraceae bacterium]|nr:hypothetical protein [Bryobacteraceae bacterium]